MPLFALILVVLVGMVAIAVDVARVRSQVEVAQQAANAGALAGVAFLPSLPDTAAQQAVTLSSENGFNCNSDPTKAITSTTNIGPGNEQYIFNCNSSTTITVNAYPGADKLQETVTTRVPATFAGVLHRGTFTVARTATAEYEDPVQLGAPDNELGFAPYETHAFDYFCSTTDIATGCTNHHPQTYPQDFYLQLKGTYAGFENGDAFSPEFMTWRDGGLGDQSQGNEKLAESPLASVGTIADPCATPCIDSNSKTVATNPYSNTENATTSGLHGYSFIFTIPGVPAGQSPQTVLLKVMDPLDECYYDGSQPGGVSLASNEKYAQVPNTSNVLQDGSSHDVYQDVTAHDGSVVSQTFVDQCGSEANWLGNAPAYSSNYESSAVLKYPVSLSFTLYKPVYSLSSDFTVAMTGTDSQTLDPLSNTGAYTMTLATPDESVGSGDTLGTTYGVQPLVLGPEFSLTPRSATAPSGCGGTGGPNSITPKDSGGNYLCTGYHHFKWFTLASVVNASTAPAYVMLVVDTVANRGNFSGGTDPYKGTFGGGGNVFSLGVCASDGSALGNIGNPTRQHGMDRCGHHRRCRGYGDRRLYRPYRPQRFGLYRHRSRGHVHHDRADGNKCIHSAGHHPGPLRR